MYIMITAEMSTNIRRVHETFALSAGDNDNVSVELSTDGVADDADCLLPIGVKDAAHSAACGRAVDVAAKSARKRRRSA